MENNERDFMKNRPGTEKANQAKDVYGPMKKTSVNIITVLLSIVLLLCIVSNFVNGRILWGCIFVLLLLLLLLSRFVAYKSDRANSKPEVKEHPDAIFKDHE